MAYPPQGGGYPQGNNPQQGYGQQQQGQGMTPHHGAPMGAYPNASSAAIQTAMTQFDLLPGENIVCQQEAVGLQWWIGPQAWFFAAIAPPMFALRFLVWWQALVATICAGHVKVSIIVTDQRLVLVSDKATLFGFVSNLQIRTIPFSSINTVQTMQQSLCWCCSGSGIQIESRAGTVLAMISDEAAVRRTLAGVSQSLAANTNVKNR